MELARNDPISWANWVITQRPVTIVTENQPLPWVQLVYRCPHIQYDQCQLWLEQAFIAQEYVENNFNKISRIQTALVDLWMHSSKLVSKDKSQEMKLGLKQE